MANTTGLPVLFATGNHAGRPAASAVGAGGLYSCTTHSLVYQTDGSSWATWATLGTSGLSDPMTTRGDIIVRNSSNATDRLAIGSTGKVLSSDGTDISWQTPSSGGDGYGPTGRYNPDRPPTTGTAAASDEFDDGSVDVAWGWTGTTPTHNETTLAGYLYVDSVKNITNKFRRAYVPGAATAFSIAAKCSIAVRDSDSSAFTWGIAVYDGSDNVLWQIYTQTAGTTHAVEAQRIFGTAGTGGTIDSALTADIYFCITRDASDVYIGYYSMDGLLWIRLGSSTVATTVAKVGFVIPTNDNSGNNRQAIADWFRVYTSATTLVGK